jgi:hypothetical protein
MQARSNPVPLIQAGMMEGNGWRKASLAECKSLPVLAETGISWELTEPGFADLGTGSGKVVVITASAARQLGLRGIAKRMRKRGWSEAIYITVWRPGMALT